jgi:flagellar biosynthesis component FlhA
VEPKSQPAEARKYLRSSASLVIAVALVLLLLAWLPAYRWFFLISLAIGLMVAGILYFWNRHRPVKEEDIENKRPLGLE